MTDKERRNNWQTLAGSPAWESCLLDLVGFVTSEGDPAVRCGRQDVMSYIFDSVHGKAEDDNA
ncbi:MAG: hypothetical protein ABFD60_07860 [Bryobacteraceae bacterium]